MTQKEFFKIYEQLPAEGYEVDYNGVYIRFKKKNLSFCPITAVAHKVTGSFAPSLFAREAGKKLKLRKSFIASVVLAADGITMGSRADLVELRTQLLKLVPKDT